MGKKLKHIKKRKSRLLFVFVLTCIFSLIIAGCATTNVSKISPTTSSTVKHPSSDATVYGSMDDSNFQPGDVLTFTVWIKSTIMLRGGQCAISFDPSLIKCDNVSEGGFFHDWAILNNCSTVVIPHPTIDNVQGRVSDIGIAIMGTAQGGPNGNGTLCTFQFTALAVGNTQPKLSNVKLADLSGNVFQPIVTNN